MSGEASWREGLCGGVVCDTDRRHGETGETQAPVGPTLGQGVAVGSQVSVGTRGKRPESLPGKRKREGSQAMRSVPQRAFPAWKRPALAGGWLLWGMSVEPWESPSLLRGSPEETPPKRHKRSARAQAAGWPLPPAGASEKCRGPRGSPRCLHLSSRETAEETGEVCQGPRAPGGLHSASRRPLQGVQGGEEMAASGG